MWRFHCRQVPGVLAGLLAGVCLGAGVIGHSQAVQADKAKQPAVADTPPLVELVLPKGVAHRITLTADNVSVNELSKTLSSAGSFNLPFDNGISLQGNRVRLTSTLDQASGERRISVRPLVAIPK